jgi:hypothetical protein
MLEYLIQMPALTPQRHFHGTFSPEDIHKIRSAPGGRPFDLEHYLAYRAAGDTLALARKPDYASETLVQYSLLCRKLAEAELERCEAAPPQR